MSEEVQKREREDTEETEQNKKQKKPLKLLLYLQIWPEASDYNNYGGDGMVDDGEDMPIECVNFSMIYFDLEKLKATKVMFDLSKKGNKPITKEMTLYEAMEYAQCGKDAEGYEIDLDLFVRPYVLSALRPEPTLSKHRAIIQNLIEENARYVWSDTNTAWMSCTFAVTEPGGTSFEITKLDLDDGYIAEIVYDYHYKIPK